MNDINTLNNNNFDESTINLSYYKQIQLKSLVFVLIFWSTTLLITTHSYQLKKLFINNILVRLILHVFYQLKQKFKFLFTYVDYLKPKNIRTNYIAIRRNLAKFIELFKSTSYIKSSTSSGGGGSMVIIRRPNYIQRIGAFFKSFFVLISNLSRSFAIIKQTFSVNLTAIVTFPYRVARALSVLGGEIRNFRRTIEQIIQIVRLPIQILIVINTFIISVAGFLRRINKPKLSKLM